MKILICPCRGLGDFIMQTPMIKALNDMYPESTIDILTGNVFGPQSVIENSPFINNILILPYDKSLFAKMKFFYNLRKYKYDVIFLPSYGFIRSYFFFSYIAQIKKRVVHISNPMKKTIISVYCLLSPNTITVPMLIENRHAMDLYYDMLEFFARKFIKRDYKYYVHILHNKNILNKFNLHEKEFIALQIGASSGKGS